MAGLGEILRETRVRQGITLEEAEAGCRVRRIFLEALERERYELLPARAYAQGLLQVYARYLGLDPEPLIQLLPPEPPPDETPLERAAERPPFDWKAAFLPLGLVTLLGLGYLAVRSAMASPGPEELLVAVPSATEIVEPAASPTTPPSAAAPVQDSPAPAATATAQSSPAASPTARRATATPVPATPTPRAATPTPAVAVAVPAVVGSPVTAATQALLALGLKVATQEQASPTVPPGTVMQQAPAPGGLLPQGQTVTLIVSRGPPGILVPNVVGMPEAAARAALTAAGLAPSPFTNYQGRDQVPANILQRFCIGCVLSTAPGAGAEVRPGTQIALAVRRE